MKLGKILKHGIFDNNPIFVQLIGMCSVLAITTNMINSIAMSIAVTVVLIGSNLVVSLIKGFIPDEIRIPAFIVVIATFVTMIEMFMEAYAQPIYNALGIFLPLIVVNCLILGRAEAFAFNNSPVASIVDGLGMGLGYGVAMLVLSTIREFFGAGTLFDIQIMPASYNPIGIMISPAGAFIVLGLVVAAINGYKLKKENKGA